MNVEDLAHVNAILNSVATVLLVTGYVMIRKGRKVSHGICMGSALLVSAVFLTSYLVYHYHVGHVKFESQGIVRSVYFTLLISHIILAVVNLPMVIMTVIPVLRRRFDKHRRIARWTLPIWLYVSVTGVIVYLMLYQWFG